MSDAAGPPSAPLSAARGVAAQVAVVALAIGLIAFAIHCDHAWLYRRTLLEFFQPRNEQEVILDGVRAGAVVLALVLVVFVRPRFGRLMTRRRARDIGRDIAPTLLAVLLALSVSEVILEHIPRGATHHGRRHREPMHAPDPRLGWTYAPNHAGRGVLGGRAIDYAFDARGHRVSRPGEQVDYGAPSILFLGESIMAGHGLTWSESIPARVQAATGLQGADLAAGGYGTDQQYLRLADELPRFKAPRAMVFLFMPALYHRNLETDRPHLVRGLVWRPQAPDLRLVQLLKRLFPYRSDREQADGEAMTIQALRGAVEMARARGAVPLILVPQLTPETAEEAAMRRRLLDAQGLPYIHVVVDPALHIRNNRHPDARGAKVLADAVSAWLIAHGVVAHGAVAQGLQGSRPVTLARGGDPRT